jgi:hypothetical protein
MNLLMNPTNNKTFFFVADEEEKQAFSAWSNVS